MATPNPGFRGFELSRSQKKSEEPLAVPPAFFEEVLINEPLSCVRVVWYVLERTLTGEEVVTASYTDFEKALHLSHSSVSDGLKRALEGGYIRLLRSGENRHAKAQYALVLAPEGGGGEGTAPGGGEGSNNPLPTATPLPEEEPETPDEPLPFGSSENLLECECSFIFCTFEKEAASTLPEDREEASSNPTTLLFHLNSPTGLKSYRSELPTATYIDSINNIESRIESVRNRINPDTITTLPAPAPSLTPPSHHQKQSEAYPACYTCTTYPNNPKLNLGQSQAPAPAIPLPAPRLPHSGPAFHPIQDFRYQESTDRPGRVSIPTSGPVSASRQAPTPFTTVTASATATYTPTPPCPGPGVALPAYLVNLSKRLSIELGDERHTASNRTQTLNLYQASGLSQKEFAKLLYQARDLTCRYAVARAGEVPPPTGGVRNTMAYFFRVVRDLLVRWSSQGQPLQGEEAYRQRGGTTSYERGSATAKAQTQGLYPSPTAYPYSRGSVKGGDKFAGWKKYLGISTEAELSGAY